jgi:RND family efflux transporter MFP subunit
MRELRAEEHAMGQEATQAVEATMVKAGLAVVAAGVLVACGGGRQAASARAPEPVRARMAAVRVLEAPQVVELSGTVEAARTSAVSSRVMATVTAVPVRQGDAVRAGQVLVEIDPETARGQEAQARGALAQAQAALALAKRNHERFKALAATGAAAELELDMARMQYEQAKGAVEQAQGAVAAAASVARESRVVAPFPGRVAARLVEVGDLAAPGRPLVVIESEQGRRIVLSVPEGVAVAARLAVGSELPVSFDALPAAGQLPGRVVEMSPGADPMSHSFTVKVDVQGVDVATGAAGRARAAVGTRRAVAVPEEAVLRSGGVAMVVVRDGEGKARSRLLTLGAAIGGGEVEALSGLAGGETVLLGLAVAPPDGAPVEEAQP